MKLASIAEPQLVLCKDKNILGENALFRELFLLFFRRNSALCHFMIVTLISDWLSIYPTKKQTCDTLWRIFPIILQRTKQDNVMTIEEQNGSPSNDLTKNEDGIVFNQWDDDGLMCTRQGDIFEGETHYFFRFMGKTYCVQLTYDFIYDSWEASLHIVEGKEIQKHISDIKIPTCRGDELSWLKQYIEKRKNMLCLELKYQVETISFELEDIPHLQIPPAAKYQMLTYAYRLWQTATTEAAANNG